MLLLLLLRFIAGIVSAIAGAACDVAVLLRVLRALSHGCGCFGHCCECCGAVAGVAVLLRVLLYCCEHLEPRPVI